jgi:hypothetical protein
MCPTGGPLKPGFGLSGAAQSWTESSCHSFVFPVVYSDSISTVPHSLLP